MITNKITVQATISAGRKKVRDFETKRLAIHTERL